MPPRTPYPLLHGPYAAPKGRIGDRLFCEIMGTVKILGRKGPMNWPYTKPGAHPLILCGDLVKAVRLESKFAVAQAWGVSRGSVLRWRRALNVPQFNDGTLSLMRSITAARTDDRLERARENSKSPAALAKMSASIQSLPYVPGHPDLKRWLPKEVKLLGKMSDAAVAKRTGWSVKSVGWKRGQLRIKRFRGGRKNAARK